jgi:hypothetical protein
MANEAHSGLARCVRPREVGCGNSHASTVEHEEWISMGWHFRDMSGVDALVVSTDNEMTA